MRLACFAAVAAACSSPSGGTKDAAVDTAQPLSFQGEYVDWDSGGSNDNNTFCGIFQATYTVHGAASGSSTPPNGRLMATLPPGTTEIDLAPPTDPSPCAGGSGTYANPGVIAADPNLVTAQLTYSARSFTTDRRDAFFTSLGLTYDDTKAQVFVNVQGSASDPSIQATHDATAAFDATSSTWGSGGNGEYVFFPNVDIVSPATTLTATGYAGTFPLPLTAGTITYAAVASSP